MKHILIALVVIAIFGVIGSVGALEFDAIGIGQCLAQSTICGIVGLVGAYALSKMGE